MSTRPELSIVIPAKNEAAHLPVLLTSLSNQDYIHLARTKVYVADAASTDGTREIALGFRDRLDVEVIDGGIPSVGRNRGAMCSDSEFILFLDSDVELRNPATIRRALLRMRSQHLHCMTVDSACADGTWADRFLYRANSAMQRLSSWLMPFGTGMFLLFDRALFHDLAVLTRVLSSPKISC